MGIKANNRPMEIVEMLREEAGVSKTEMAKVFSSRTKYYEHLEANDIKVGVFRAYLRKLGYDLKIGRTDIEM